MKVGVHEIAQLANVSIGTVDRALHGRKEINFETRQRILRIAHNLGYRPNLAARSLAVGRAPLRIGVCIPREVRVFYDEVRRGILDEARRFESWGVRILYRPVARLGAGSGVATKARAKRAPLRDRMSMFGVRISRLP